MNAKLDMAMEPDFEEISEWIEAFDQVVDQGGISQGTRLLDALTKRAQHAGVDIPVQLNTPYINTIPTEEEEPYPGDRILERRIKSLIRWNAMAMVHRQNKKDPGIGGHISTYSSLATLLEVGFNHFFHATYGDQPGDFVFLPAPLADAEFLAVPHRFDGSRTVERDLPGALHALSGEPESHCPNAAE